MMQKCLVAILVLMFLTCNNAQAENRIWCTLKFIGHQYWTSNSDDFLNTLIVMDSCAAIVDFSSSQVVISQNKGRENNWLVGGWWNDDPNWVTAGFAATAIQTAYATLLRQSYNKFMCRRKSTRWLFIGECAALTAYRIYTVKKNITLAYSN